MEERGQPDGEGRPVDRGVEMKPGREDRRAGLAVRRGDRLGATPAKVGRSTSEPLTAPVMAAPGLTARSVASSRFRSEASAASILVTTSRSAISICRRPSGSLAEMREPVDGVDRDDDLADHDVVDKHGVGADRLDDRRGVGEAAGLEDDLGRVARRR